MHTNTHAKVCLLLFVNISSGPCPCSSNTCSLRVKAVLHIWKAFSFPILYPLGWPGNSGYSCKALLFPEIHLDKGFPASGPDISSPQSSPVPHPASVPLGLNQGHLLREVFLESPLGNGSFNTDRSLFPPKGELASHVRLALTAPTYLGLWQVFCTGLQVL